MKRILLHISFWVIYVIQDSMMIFTWMEPSFKHLSGTTLFTIALADSLFMLIPKMLLCYFVLYVSIRKMLLENSDMARIVTEILFMFFVAIMISRALLKYIISPYIFKSSAPGDPLFDLRSILTAFMSIGCVAGLAAFIKFVRIQIASKEREKNLVKQKLETELKFLRNQTNPHFLFNTLNNIYGLARRKSDITPDAVMKLSKILRFMLYESKEDLIKISDEIKLLENYIDLEGIRYTEILTVRFKKDIDDESEQIAPLLLLPFVENAFKHGASESRFDSVINIDMKLSDGILIFSVVNTREPGSQNKLKENIGLSNVKRQLELMYRKYDLQVHNETNLFRILLTVNLKVMQKYNCIIVEDEPIAAEVLHDYINQVPFLELRGVCRDAIYAMDILQKDSIEIIFLDIHLPILKGLDFIKTLKNPPGIIITTAYQEYALQGYELNVIDYLLKPIEFSRFLTAVNKLRQQGISSSLPSTVPVSDDKPHLFFNVSKRQVKIYLDEILFIESLREYVRITTKEKNILTKMQLGEIEEMLPKNCFLRVHRSFIVSKQKIEAFSHSEIEITAKQIPIGRNYKELVMLNLQMLNQ